MVYLYIWHERFQHFTASFRRSDRLTRVYTIQEMHNKFLGCFQLGYACSVASDQSWRWEAAQRLGEGRGCGATRTSSAGGRARHLHKRRCQCQSHRRAQSTRQPVNDYIVLKQFLCLGMKTSMVKCLVCLLLYTFFKAVILEPHKQIYQCIHAVDHVTM